MAGCRPNEETLYRRQRTFIVLLMTSAAPTMLCIDRGLSVFLDWPRSHLSFFEKIQDCEDGQNGKTLLYTLQYLPEGVRTKVEGAKALT